LSAGVYSLKATAPGFSTVETKSIELLVGRNIKRKNFSLSPGAVSETVEVPALLPLVDQTKTDVSNQHHTEQITELPLIGRDIAGPCLSCPWREGSGFL